MAECLCDHDKCPILPEPKCLWPNYHKDIVDINNDKYRGIPLVGDVAETRRVCITRYLKATESTASNNPENIQLAVEKQLILLLKELFQKLKCNVYDEEDLKVLKKVRFLTDLKGLLIKLKARGVIIISSLQGQTFVDYAKSICHTINDIPTDSLKLQYKLFLNQLNDCYQNMTQCDLDKLTSMKIIKTSKFNHFEGIELVMHVTCAASVIMSVESGVESSVSLYENRQSKFRNLDP